jgi:putative CocE/NonD family hydrolase
MRDGVGLRTRRIAPADGGRYPTLLVRTPYGTGWQLPLPIIPFIARTFASRGYNVVLQDTRGRYGSEGIFYPFVHELADGRDTLAWIAEQPWFDGRLGMWGGSYFGYTQWAVAADAPPFLKALVPILTSTDFYGLFYPGGAFSLISSLRWASSNGERRARFAPERRLPAATRVRPMRDATRAAGRRTPFFEDWTAHPLADDYWERVNLLAARERSRIPALSVAGSYDIFNQVQIEDYLAMRDHTWLDLGPWAHGSFAISPRRLGWKRAGALGILRSSLAFLDHHLHGMELTRPRVRRYVQGCDHWVDESDWPPPDARRQRLYLRAGGRLDREPPGGEQGSDGYRYDPEHPVPTRGGTFLGPKAGPADQRPLEGRPDILFYDTAPLPGPLEIAGGVRLRLFASSDAAASDFTGKLVQLPADPKRPALNLCEGIRRLNDASGDVIQVDVDLCNVSAVIPAGDRLRLEVSSSNFPRFDAHPNLPGNPAHATRAVVAQQTIHRSASSASYLELCVLE